MGTYGKLMELNATRQTGAPARVSPSPTPSGIPTETYKVPENGRLTDGPTDRPNDPSFHRTTEKKLPRMVVRHTFDVYHDQLIRLQRLQIAAMSAGRRKPKLGRMVQKALDLYLRREEQKVGRM